MTGDKLELIAKHCINKNGNVSFSKYRKYIGIAFAIEDNLEDYVISLCRNRMAKCRVKKQFQIVKQILKEQK